MAASERVKPDPTVWLPLLDEEYELTTLPGDTVLRGTLREGLSVDSPEVRDVLEAWPGQAHLSADAEGVDVVLVYQIKEPRPAKLGLHLLLFFLTVVTTLGSGALMTGVDPFATRLLEVGELVLPYPSGFDLSRLVLGLSFAGPFLGVLLAHEMSHVWAARRHGVRATLPYFIPFPPYFSLIGSLGAFIRLKGPTVRRSSLFDIGASGPLASFLVSIPLLVIGLARSQAVPGAASLSTPFVIRFVGEPVWLGNGLMTHVLASLFGPARVGETLILLHPLALAGWLGLFVTALNLLPLGQLDGGHIVYAISPGRHARIARLFLLTLIPLGFLWWGWWAWAALVWFIHRGRVAHPRVIQPGPGIGRKRDALAWMLILVFFATLVPVPIEL